MSRLKRIAAWIEDRLGLGKSMQPMMDHQIPRRTASFFYVFGSAAMTALAVQLVTGVMLALVYVPAADMAYDSLLHLTFVQPLGWFLRGVHGWGSNVMVACVFLHMIQVVIFAAYKYPRELTWVVGVLLLLCTVGMAFTGQVLRWDSDAYWGLGIGASIMGRIPFIGPEVVHVLLGGPIIGGEALTRFFALHVFVIPASLIGLLVVHLMLVLKNGVNEWPIAGRRVDKKTYRENYEKQVEGKRGVPFWPVAAKKDMIFSACVIFVILLCAAIIGPIGPSGPPDPGIIDTEPRPDFLFLSLFAVMALLPPHLETAFILIVPVLAIGLLIAVPFLSGDGEKHWSRRPVALIVLGLVVINFVVFSQLGVTSPWSPEMKAWSGTPTPVEYVEGRTPLELQGALVLQNMQCRNCHSLDGEGGRRGPALDAVAARMTENQLIRQVLQGHGNMPAYGGHLSPPEVTALVSFLRTLNGGGIRPRARPSIMPAKPGGPSAAPDVGR
ncbi:MAG: cytochrome b N-terminal domain-containing protein [Planctomycetota bacterium]|jgi:ubiquinol-cytochrome c reductase cytochrome b subunit|nr:cytochrome b N-terminal domain-containing protein [Planctomycetota bacterium]